MDGARKATGAPEFEELAGRAQTKPTLPLRAHCWSTRRAQHPEASFQPHESDHFATLALHRLLCAALSPGTAVRAQRAPKTRDQVCHEPLLDKIPPYDPDLVEDVARALAAILDLESVVNNVERQRCDCDAQTTT